MPPGLNGATGPHARNVVQRVVPFKGTGHAPVTELMVELHVILIHPWKVHCPAMIVKKVNTFHLCLICIH